MNQPTKTNRKLARMSIALGALALLMIVVPAATAEDLDNPSCRGAIACGVVHAECILQTVAAAGVSSDPNTEWTFTAYNSYGGQSYTKITRGAVFADQHAFASGIGGIIVVRASLSANGQVVGSAAIGCMF